MIAAGEKRLRYLVAVHDRGLKHIGSAESLEDASQLYLKHWQRLLQTEGRSVAGGIVVDSQSGKQFRISDDGKIWDGDDPVGPAEEVK